MPADVPCAEDEEVGLAAVLPFDDVVGVDELTGTAREPTAAAVADEQRQPLRGGGVARRAADRQG